MRFGIPIEGKFKEVSDCLTQMSFNNPKVFLPGFSLKSDWNIIISSNHFIASKPFKLFEYFDRSQSNFTAKIYLEEDQAIVEIRLKSFSIIVLSIAIIFVLFFIFSAILDGTYLGYITILFPFLYAYGIQAERRDFILSVKNLINGM